FAKAVVTPTVFGLNHQAALNQQRVLVVGEDRRQSSPVFAGPTNRKAGGNLAAQPPILEILNSRLRMLEIRLVEAPCSLPHLFLARHLLLALLIDAPLAWRTLRFGHRHTDSGR